MMTPYLFVYGTLREYSTSIASLRLKEESTFRVPAKVYGELYNLGGCPGLVITPYDGGVPKVVIGELIRLFEPRKTFDWLDAYEGAYERREVWCFRPSIEPTHAWTYIWDDERYMKNGRGLALIEEGDWCKFLERKNESDSSRIHSLS